MEILNRIISRKKEEVAEAKKNVSIEKLKALPDYSKPSGSFKNALINSSIGIIAEFKRKSPSKGWLNENADVLNITKGYDAFGAVAVSVLTDHFFFGGSLDDLQVVSQQVSCPVLRKDFMVDSYQLHEAKAYGADVILLIAAALSPEKVKELSEEAYEIGLEVLLEIHNESELENICNSTPIVGVNNRDLKSFSVDLQTSIDLSSLIPADKIKISESGIADASAIHRLRSFGFSGFLIGETFMKEADPVNAFKLFKENLL
ncbi:indole-3-glycerol phosphate synthase TrpC [soil metagenome]